MPPRSKRGHDVTLVDLRFGRPVEHYLKARPGFVGIAAMHALETENVLDLVARIRRTSPEVPLVGGGHTAAAYPAPFVSSGQEPDFERLWDFMDRNGLHQAGFTILTPLPGTAYFEEMRPRLGARKWAHFDMHHLLWEPALGPQRFFELYCETWRRSVLNLGGRKSVWQWLRQVEPRNAAFLLKALWRTQGMMDRRHYLAEYDLGSPAESVTGTLPSVH